MRHVSLTELRAHMARYFDAVVQNRESLVITRPAGKGNVVLMSEGEFASWQETVHLLTSPTNAARLMASVGQARKGTTRERPLLAPAEAPGKG